MTTGTSPRTGRIVAGGFRDVSFDSEFTADEQLTDPVQTALQGFVNGLMGRELRVDYAWAGIFGMVMDFLPVVGRVPGLENVVGGRRLFGPRERAGIRVRRARRRRSRR